MWDEKSLNQIIKELSAIDVQSKHLKEIVKNAGNLHREIKELIQSAEQRIQLAEQRLYEII